METRKLNAEELEMLGFQEGTITTNAHRSFNVTTNPIEIDFERDGKTITGVIDGTTEDGLLTAIYSYGEVWGGLVLHPENHIRIAKDKKKARESARVYCERELESLASYGDDPYARAIAADVAAVYALLK